MARTKTTIELTDKQCIAMFDCMTKIGMAVSLDEVANAEEGFEELFLNECNEQQKIFYGKAFYELLTKQYPSPIIDDEQAFYIFNANVLEYPENNETGKEVAEILLEAAPTKEEQIALGKIIWQLLYSYEKMQTE